MKILLLTKYDKTGASSRYRSLQYLPALAQQGYDYTVSPLFDAAYLQSKYAGNKRWLLHAVLAYIRRLKALLCATGYDRIVIEYEALPYLPYGLEAYLLKRLGPYVLDYDDALYHQYDKHRFAWVQRLLGTKIGQLMEGAEQVIVGNAYLAAYADRWRASAVNTIPTVIDLDKYPLQQRPKSTEGAALHVCWIGSPSTAQYLKAIEVVLSQLIDEGIIRVTIIGAGNDHGLALEAQFLPWSEQTELSNIAACDVGIMPLPDTPWARGKCGFKLIQYMACRLAVVASPVGVNSEIVERGQCGYLAQSLDQWRQALVRLHAAPDSRVEMGEHGRRAVETVYSLQAQERHWLDAILGGTDNE